MSESFLVFVVDRFEMEAICIHLIDANGIQKRLQVKEIASLVGTVVTHDVGLLLRLMRRHGVTLACTLVDIEEGLRLASQISKDQGGERQWGFWRQVELAMPDPITARTMLRLVNYEIGPPSAEEIAVLASNLVAGLALLWEATKEAMSIRDEWNRFLNLEIPVQQIFHQRELSGIQLNTSVISEFIRSCENEKYKLFCRIAEEIGESPLGLSDQLLASKLLGHENEAERNEGLPLEGWIEMAAIRSQWASILLDYLRAKRDVKILREANALGGRIFPRFHVHGTVTSRVLVSEPRLQNLRKKFRPIVAPDAGYELCYLDYAQFEPAILGVLAKDVLLINSYASGDLYLALGQAMGEGVESRGLAKKIFLSFLYGMSQSAIKSILDRQTTAKNSQGAKVVEFFSHFAEVEMFRGAVKEQLIDNSVVVTALGNGRRRTRTGSLNLKESRWALNHLVQATASLIFKSALVKIASLHGPRSILLPMHDAVLLQHPVESSAIEFRVSCSQAMQQAFEDFCPGLTVRVTHGDF